MVWTAVILTNLLIIRGDSVALTLFANLIVYTLLAFGLSFLLHFINKIKYPIGTILGSLPPLGLAFYVYVAFDTFIQNQTVPFVNDPMVVGLLGFIPLLIAVMPPLVYVVFYCQDNTKSIVVSK